MVKQDEQLKTKALNDISVYLRDLSNSKNQKDQKKATLLAYWISDYVKFQKQENNFDPKKLIRYKRGQIVQVHLGFRVGSEHGGLHYAIVIENDNPLSAKVVTIIPLTSVKEKSDIKNLHYSEVYLGDEIYNNVHQKIVTLKTQAEESLEKHNKEQHLLSDEELNHINEQLENTKKMENRISKMKKGSIALVNQITTISKQRIYDPLNSKDTFTSIRLSDSSLDIIDKKIIANFTNKNKKM